MTRKTHPQNINDQEGGKPSMELVSRSAIRKEFLCDTLQDKTVLLPWSIAALGFLYNLLYAPVLGGAFPGITLGILAGAAGTGMFLWRFGILYRTGYTRKLQQMVAQIEAENAKRLKTRLRDMNNDLEQGFSEMGYRRGIRILHRLENEYEALQPVIHQTAETDLLSISNITPLVTETYTQGLNVLGHALDLERAVNSTNRRQLEVEIGELEQKLSQAKDNLAGSESLALIQEKIDMNKERLTLVTKLHQRVEELLHQADSCEASINKTRIELAALKADASGSSVTSVIEALQKTINRAKEVQVELIKLGY